MLSPLRGTWQDRLQFYALSHLLSPTSLGEGRLGFGIFGVEGQCHGFVSIKQTRHPVANTAVLQPTTSLFRGSLSALGSGWVDGTGSEGVETGNSLRLL